MRIIFKFLTKIQTKQGGDSVIKCATCGREIDLLEEEVADGMYCWDCFEDGLPDTGDYDWFGDEDDEDYEPREEE